MMELKNMSKHFCLNFIVVKLLQWHIVCQWPDILKRFYWPTLFQDTKEYSQSFLECQLFQKK